MAKEIVCIGSLSQDVFFPCDHIDLMDTPGDTLSKQKMAFEVGAKYRAKDRYEAPGGCATNVSQGLSLLGVHSILVSNVGRDALGDSLLQEVRESGVDTSFVRRLSDRKTDLSAIIVDASSGERTIFYNRDANEQFEIEDHIFQEGRLIFVGGLYGEWKEPLLKILSHSEKKALPIYYNPSQSNIHDDVETVWEVCSKSKGIFLNKDEAMELLLLASKKTSIHSDVDHSRIESEEYLCVALASTGNLEFVVLTDGSRGAWVYDRGSDSIFRCKKAMSDQVLDSTGAGDAFTSGFLGAISYGLSPKEALSWGIVNSTNVIRFYGGKEGLLSRESIEERVQTLSCSK